MSAKVAVVAALREHASEALRAADEPWSERASCVDEFGAFDLVADWLDSQWDDLGVDTPDRAAARLALTLAAHRFQDAARVDPPTGRQVVTCSCGWSTVRAWRDPVGSRHTHEQHVAEALAAGVAALEAENARLRESAEDARRVTRLEERKAEEVRRELADLRARVEALARRAGTYDAQGYRIALREDVLLALLEAATEPPQALQVPADVATEVGP